MLYNMRPFALMFISLFVLSCSSGGGENQRLKGPLATEPSPARTDEPFDLKVKKYEDPTRQSWQDPQFVLDELGDLTGKTVADIGSGTGYFTFQLAAMAEKVIAIDIEPRFLNYIEDRKFELSNSTIANRIETRLIEPNEPSLADEEADVVLIVNSIAYIDNRAQYLKKVRLGIKKNGRVVIVDYKLGDLPVGPEKNLKVGVEQLKKELEAAGFRISRTDTSSLQYQYMINSTNF